jgi:alkanesulfonate monooxygenase SsuD/methylene tetrahydromethanopterin reductase-like flavin-dependent oxidoreductase (luciferase family)
MVLARHVDAAGWHTIYQCDHFMPHAPDGGSLRGPVSECWTTLSALATLTSQVRLGSLVLGNTYRHPAIVANMATTLDQISGGRVTLGIGAGWQPNEHLAYGIPLADPGERIDALGETCTILRMLLDEGRCTFSGETYQLRDATCDPAPVQTRLPLLVGGAGERTMKIAAEHADVWHCWADPTTLATKKAVLDRHCHDVGRDPATIATATGGTVAVHLDQQHRLGNPDSCDVEGTPAEVAERLLEFRTAGTEEFIVRDQASVSVATTVDLIDALTDDILPSIDT